MAEERNLFVQTIPALIFIAIIGFITYYYTSDVPANVCPLLHQRVLQGGIALLTLVCMVLYYPLQSAPLLSRILLFLGIPLGGLALAFFLSTTLSQNEDLRTYFVCNCESLKSARQLIDSGNPDGALTVLNEDTCQKNDEHARFIKEAQSLKIDLYLKGAEQHITQGLCTEAKGTLEAAKKFITLVAAPHKETLTRLVAVQQNFYDNSVKCGKPAPKLPPEVTISAIPTKMDSGASFSLEWKSKNVTSCVAEGDWEDKIETAGTMSLVAPDASGKHTFKIRCAGTGPDAIAQVSITVKAKITLKLELLGIRNTHGVIDFRLKSDDASLTDVQRTEIVLSKGIADQLQLRTENDPTCIIAVVDNSRSIIQGPDGGKGLLHVQQAIETLNQWQVAHPNVELGMVVFDETLQRTLPDKLPLKPKTITATGDGTFLWSAVEDGLKLAMECSTRVSVLNRYLFVITDGENTQKPPFPDPKELRQTAVAQQTGICTVGIAGRTLREPLLKDLAEGCDYKLADTAAKVATILKQNLDNTANSYRLTTTPNFCPLTLELRNEKLTVSCP